MVGIPPVTDSDLASFLAGHRLAVVDVGAAWCAPCRRLDPVVDELAEELAGRVEFRKLDADANPKTVARFGVLGLPTLLVFKDGARVAQLAGVRPKDELKRAFLAHA